VSLSDLCGEESGPHEGRATCLAEHVESAVGHGLMESPWEKVIAQGMLCDAICAAHYQSCLVMRCIPPFDSRTR
jgi:hypothetical protein